MKHTSILVKTSNKNNKELLEQTKIKLLEKTYDILIENEKDKKYDDAMQLIVAINELTGNEGYKDNKKIEKRIHTKLEKINRGLGKFLFIVVTLIVQLILILGLFCLSPLIEGFPIGDFIECMFEEYRYWTIFFFTICCIHLFLLNCILRIYYHNGYLKVLSDTMQAIQIFWIFFGIFQIIIHFEFFEDEDFISIALTPIINCIYFTLCKIIIKVKNIF